MNPSNLAITYAPVNMSAAIILPEKAKTESAKKGGKCELERNGKDIVIVVVMSLS